MLNQSVGNYRILSEIARGGIGVVYEAEHERIGTRVAIKVLPAYHSSDADLVDRLFTEAKVVNKIGHPGLVGIKDCGLLPDGTPYLIMELVRGQSLRQRFLTGPLSTAERALLKEVAEAMAAAHAQGIVHRDLSPGNIMILQGDPPRAKVLDFGMAKVTEDLRSRRGPHPRTGLVGTVEYTAPEQWEDASLVTDRADVYALGVILYEALAGRRPFAGTQLGLMRQHALELPPKLDGPHVPPELAALCFQMLAKKPGERPDMIEVARCLVPVPPKRALLRIGNYVLGRELGRGSYGRVVEAVHERLGERHAAKLLLPGMNEQLVQRFFNEALAASRARHPHIIEVFDCGMAEEHPYILMEFLSDGSLQDLLDKGNKPPLAIYRQIAEAMAAAHAQGIVHRDLKPGNVMLQREGQGYCAKVVDFGIAKLDEARFGSVVKRVQSAKGQPMGTPLFMAPEQWQDASGIGERADVYSLGMMLYQAVSGGLPFSGGNQIQLMLRHLNEAPPPLAIVSPLVPLIMRMLDKDPKRRPGMVEVAREIAEAEGGADLGDTLKPPAPVEGTRPNKQVYWIGAAAAGVLGVIGLGVFGFSGKGPSPEPMSSRMSTAPSAQLPVPVTPPAKVHVVLLSLSGSAQVFHQGDEDHSLGETGAKGLDLEVPAGQPMDLILKLPAFRPTKFRLDPKKGAEQIVKLDEDL